MLLLDVLAYAVRREPVAVGPSGRVASIGRMPPKHSFDDAEASLRATARQDLPALAIARSATEALAVALDGAAVPPAGEPPPPAYYAASALLMLSTMGLRTARAALIVIASGYEPEAHGLKRRLSEIHARAQAVADDASGQHARQWLEGRGPSTPRKITAKYGSLDLFDTYSASEHADARGMHWWLTVPTEGEQRGLLVQPHRRPRFSNAILTEIAMETRDLVAVLEVVRNGRVDGLDTLTALIDQAIAAYYPPPDGFEVEEDPGVRYTESAADPE